MNEPDVIITDIKTVLELKEKLSIYVNSEIQDFISKTGLYPKISIKELEMPMRCGLYRTIELTFTLEL